MNEHSKYLPVKVAIENLFGEKAWYSLKESNRIPVWQKYTEKTLKAVRVSIHESVKHFDSEWRDEIDHEIEGGINSIKYSKSIDEIIAALAGALINVSFLQVGYMPRRKCSTSNITLRKENWDFSHHRSVIYLQSQEQKETLFWGNQQRKIGFEEQKKMRSEYKNSKSKLPYSEWCKNNE